jgi:ribose transport system substrate-binding protein
MVKRILALSLAAVTCFVLVACSTGTKKPATKKQITLGLTVDEMSAYLTPLVSYAKSEAKKDGATLEVVNAQSNSQTQANEINTFIEQKVGAVLLIPVDMSSMLPSLQKLKAAKVPCVNVNMKVDDVSSTYCASFVGSSMQAEAQIAADLTNQALGGNGGNVVIIEGSPGSDASYYRTVGFENEIAAKYKNIKILGTANGAWDRATALSVTEDLLTKYPNINAIYAHDDNMCIGAYEAAKAVNRASSIKFIGIGGSIDGLAAIKSGEMYGSVTQGPDYEGETAVDVGVKLAMGESVNAWYMDPIQPITASNVDQFKGLW